MPDIDAKPVILEGYCIRALSLAAGLLLGSGFPAAFAERFPLAPQDRAWRADNGLKRSTTETPLRHSPQWFDR